MVGKCLKDLRECIGPSWSEKWPACVNLCCTKALTALTETEFARVVFGKSNFTLVRDM